MLKDEKQELSKTESKVILIRCIRRLEVTIDAKNIDDFHFDAFSQYSSLTTQSMFMVNYWLLWWRSPCQ